MVVREIDQCKVDHNRAAVKCQQTAKHILGLKLGDLRTFKGMCYSQSQIITEGIFNTARTVAFCRDWFRCGYCLKCVGDVPSIRCIMILHNKFQI